MRDLKPVKSKRRKRNKGEVFSEFLTPSYALPSVPYGLDQSDVQLELRKSLAYLLAGILILALSYFWLNRTALIEVATPPATGIAISGTVDPGRAAFSEQAAATAGDAYQQYQNTEATAAFQPAPNQVQEVSSGDMQPAATTYSLQGSVGTASIHHPDGLR